MIKNKKRIIENQPLIKKLDFMGAHLPLSGNLPHVKKNKKFQEDFPTSGIFILCERTVKK